jgi:predicted DNA-binding helix-hairpin-helix protein
MQTFIKPDTITRLAQVGAATQYEPAGDQPLSERRRAPYQSQSLGECITNVATPAGKRPILKTLLTTACERNCFYCPFRAGRSKTKRITFTPDELAGGFDTLQRARQVDGLFLSSGIIKGSVTTQDKIIDAVMKYNLKPEVPFVNGAIYCVGDTASQAPSTR